MFRKLFGETVIYGLGTIMPRVINFIIQPFIIHYSNAADFSKFGQLYALVAFVNVVLSFGFETAFFRFSSEKGKESSVFSTSFWFLSAISIVFLILSILFYQNIANYFEYSDTPEYILWFAIIAFVDALCVIPYAWLRFNNKPIYFSVVRIVSISMHTMIVFALIYLFSKSTLDAWGLKEVVSYAFLGNLVGSILALLLLIPIFKNLKLKFDFSLLKKMLPYAVPIMIAGLAFATNEHFDKLIQRNVISKSDAGAYAGMYKLAALMSILVTAYRFGIEPFFFKQMHSENARDTYSKIMTFFVAFASVVALGIIANVSWLKNILADNPEYWVAIDIVPIIVIAYLFFGVYYNLSTWYKVTDQTWVGTVISWLGAGLTLLLTYIYLPKIGFMASAWITLLIYFLMMLVSFVWGQKKYPIPYQVSKVLLYMGLCIILSLISYVFAEQNIIIGNILLILFAAFILYNESGTLYVKKLLKR